MSQTNGATLCYVRGDTAKKSFVLQQDGSPVDLTGTTGIVLTVTAEKTGTESIPAPTVIAQFDGSLSGTPTDGRIFFQPQGIDEAARQIESDGYTVGKFNYSLRWVDSSGSEATPIAQGKFEMLEAKTTA